MKEQNGKESSKTSGLNIFLVLQNRPTSTLSGEWFALSSYAETTLIKYWVTEREREGCEMVGVFGDSWETAHSSFLQHMRWAQHNILETDKIPFHPPSSLSFFWVTIDSLMLSDHCSRSDGSYETRQTQTHTHSPFPEAHRHTHKFPVGIYFQISYLRSPAVHCSCCQPHPPASITSLKHQCVREKLERKWELQG